MDDNDFDSGVLIGPLAFVVREHEAHRAALKGGLSVAVGGVNVVGDQATSLPIATCSTKAASSGSSLLRNGLMSFTFG